MAHSSVLRTPLPAPQRLASAMMTLLLSGLPLHASLVQAASTTTATATSSTTSAQQSTPLSISTTITATHLTWQASAAHGAATLRLGSRSGEWLRDITLPTNALALSAQDAALPDGEYTFELTLAPALAATRSRSADESIAPVLVSNTQGATQSGYVSVRAGRFVLPVTETSDPGVTVKSALLVKDAVVTQDSIVQGRVCAGLDCAATEAFGSDTLRMKENNTRLKFEETRTASAPTRVWQIIANDVANGGANFLGIEDVTGALMPIRWMAGAPANSLLIDAQGRLGARTATPAQDIHIRTGDTPGIRHEQNTTSGFTPQTWDVAGNEANFFVRDLSSGSLLPLRIRPGAPQSSLDIASSGSIGLGTPRPTAALHVRRADGNAKVLVENTTTASTSPVVELKNDGPVVAALLRGSPATRWTATADSADFRFAGDSGVSALAVQANGGLTVPGILSQGSSRSLKHDIKPVGVESILQSVRKLPVYAWQYRSDQNASTHLGPMAEDVHQATQLGESPRRLAPSDIASLATAAVQALNQQLAARDAELNALQQRFLELESRLTRQLRSQP